MAFFENLSKKVQDVAFVAAEKGKEVAAVAGEKAQIAAESVRISAAIAGEQRVMDRNYRAIGEWYVSEAEGELPAAIADIVRAVQESKAKIAELEAQHPSKDGAAAAVNESGLFCGEPAAKAEDAPACAAENAESCACETKSGE